MFENTLMLAGLGGAVVPIVIHLLGRARYRTIDWGAMMFIASGEPRWRDGAKLREWALLLVRVAAVAMLAIALARPLAGGAQGGSTGGVSGSGSSINVSGLAVASPDSRVAAAIVVDCSASMAYEDVGGSRMERAASATLQILSTLRRGDRAALILAGAGQNNNDNPPQMTGDLQSLATRATELKPTPGVADLAEAITTAANLLDRQDRFTRQLYVICDRQAASWRFVGPDLFAPARNHSQLARFFVVPVGGEETDNLSIESIALLNPPVIRGCATQVSVRIRNHGPLPRTGVPLLLRVGGKDVFTETLNIGGNEAKAIIATLRFDVPGSSVLTAELSGAGPNLDDRRSFVVDVSPPLKVLIVRGGEDDATMLKAALAPFASGHREGDDLAEVTVTPVEAWDPATLAKYSIVILHDVPAPTAGQSAALEQFVYAGGGLLIAPGEAANVDLYNQRLYRDESGLLPAMLDQPIAPESEFSIDPGTLDTSHPLLRLFAQHTALVTAVTGERYIPTQRLTPSAHVLAEYERGGGAFLIESAYGRGRVVLISSSLGASWSNLPLTNLYLPLLQSTVCYLAGANLAERNVGFGQELLANFTPPAPGVRGEVVRPDGSRDECDLTTIAPRTEARYRRTDYPGLYMLHVGPRGGERSAQFSVAPPPAESDLTPLAEADWQRLEQAIGFRRLDLREGVAGNNAIAATGGGYGAGEYWLAALTAVMVLLVVELALTRAWAWETR